VQVVRFEHSGDVGAVVLTAPPFNRIDRRFAEQLGDAVREAARAPIRALAIRADGPNFSLGGEVREWARQGALEFRAFVAELNASYRAIEALAVPTLAIVRGAAIGGGLELALCCDFTVASSDAVFRCSEVTTGMVPLAGGLQRIAARVGRARAANLAMLGEPFSGELAGELGLVSHVASELDLELTAAELVQQLASGPTRAFRAARALLDAWSTGGVEAADALMVEAAVDLYATADAAAGVRNAAEALEARTPPRPAVFRGT
jgi:enoyl-CoA hydratase/carnithine racemase